MQEEVTRGAVTLIVDGAKLSEQVFEKDVYKRQVAENHEITNDSRRE